MKASKMIIPTLKEAPQEAIIDSHILMLRAGLIRKLVSGVYNYLPLGLRSLHKVEKIIKEEMDRSGALEILSSAMQPKELWEESGRWNKYGPELFRFKDRHDRDYCLGPTHEEIFTDLIRNTVKSYKQLPLNIYQIQTKYRDEMRPRFGLMRGREFIMKDAYSFDIDEKGLDESYKIMYETYSRIFTRLGLNYKVVLADTGAIGGNASHQFMALSDIGESNIIYCENCSYAADEEKAYSHAPSLEKEELKDREEVLTVNKHSIEEVSEFLNLPLYKIAKSMIYYAEDSKQYGMFIVRGDYEVNEIKVANALNSSEVFIRLASDEEISALGSIAGFIGPVNFSKCQIFIDEEVTKMSNFVVGANKKDYHLVNVNYKKDFDGTIGDYKKAKEGDLCPICGKPLKSERGIEVGQVFKLGTKYSLPMNCTFLNEQGKTLPMVMGCYGIGVTRTFQAIIEQHHDEYGIVFPLETAPYHIVIVPVNYDDEAQRKVSDKLYEMLNFKVETVLDDRKMKIGFKMKDWELIGIPYIVVVGRRASENIVELKNRNDNSKVELTLEEVKEFIIDKVNDLK